MLSLSYAFIQKEVNFLKVHGVSGMSGKMEIDEKFRSSPNLFHFILKLSWLCPTYLSSRGLGQEFG